MPNPYAMELANRFRLAQPPVAMPNGRSLPRAVEPVSHAPNVRGGGSPNTRGVGSANVVAPYSLSKYYPRQGTPAKRRATGLPVASRSRTSQNQVLTDFAKKIGVMPRF